ncbi:MAG: hypothetical protein KA793_05320 [Bacteroidales bacterium]|nr:hypothetical protein [Bacteroidales bacterium]
MKHLYYLIILFFALILLSVFSSCKPDEPLPPAIELLFESGDIADGDTVAVGGPLRFTITATGADANITNFLVEKVYDGNYKTVLDSGLNSTGFTVKEVYYQGVEEEVSWKFSVMDRNRKSASVSLKVIKDPDSQFGGIIEFNEIVLGYQSNTLLGHFFLPILEEVYFQDSATLFQDQVDVLTYFNYSEDNGVNMPSPTFSSPGEDAGAYGLLYTEYYPFLTQWTTRNYTKYDIRADHGVSSDDFNSAHNDSLLIVSYDDVWGKKKYKWAVDGTIIPFQTAGGKKGLIKVLQADTVATGSIKFAMKIQL